MSDTLHCTPAFESRLEDHVLNDDDDVREDITTALENCIDIQGASASAQEASADAKEAKAATKFVSELDTVHLDLSSVNIPRDWCPKYLLPFVLKGPLGSHPHVAFCQLVAERNAFYKI